MSLLERRASRKLKELAQSLRQYTDGADGSDTFPTAIQGLSILRSDQANRPASCLFKPALYMTLQGAKWATFGEKRYKFGAGQFIVNSFPILNYIDKHPVADRLLLNLIQNGFYSVTGPVAPLPADFETQLRNIGYTD